MSILVQLHSQLTTAIDYGIYPPVEHYGQLAWKFPRGTTFLSITDTEAQLRQQQPDNQGKTVLRGVRWPVDLTGDVACAMLALSQGQPATVRPQQMQGRNSRYQICLQAGGQRLTGYGRSGHGDHVQLDPPQWKLLADTLLAVIALPDTPDWRPTPAVYATLPERLWSARQTDGAATTV